MGKKAEAPLGKRTYNRDLDRVFTTPEQKISLLLHFLGQEYLFLIV